MNWGLKITLLYGGFVALIVTLVVICMAQDDLHLVSINYYEEEIAYQAQIDKIKAGNELAEGIKIDLDGTNGKVIISYPDNFDLQEGKIVFFRPSDATKDFVVLMDVGENNSQELNLKTMEKGLWKVQMTGKVSGRAFYKEEKLVK